MKKTVALLLTLLLALSALLATAEPGLELNPGDMRIEIPEDASENGIELGDEAVPDEGEELVLDGLEIDGLDELDTLSNDLVEEIEIDAEGLLPEDVEALTEQPSGVSEEIQGEVYTVESHAQRSYEELFDGYLQRIFYKGSLAANGTMAKNDAGSALTGKDRETYDYIKAEVLKIADGQRTSTKIDIPVTLLFDKLQLTAEDLGVETEGRDFDDYYDELWPAAKATIENRMKSIMEAISADCIYELYWWDGWYTLYESVYFISFLNYDLEFSEEACWGLWMPIYDSCLGDAEDFYSFDTTKLQNAKQAVKNAHAIVDKYASESDYVKLYAYAKTICDYVDYDYEVYEGKAPGIRAGDMVPVFDGDENTKAICEGYTQAFQYLCDMSHFDNAECYNTSGLTENAEAHAWNTVRMEDGKSYLVDVTWMDGDWDDADGGLADWIIQERGCLFLCGASSGNASDGYIVDYRFGGATTERIYGDSCKSNPVMALAKSPYILKGWQKIEGQDYYFDDGGHILRGIQKLDGTYRFFEANGVYRGEAPKEWNVVDDSIGCVIKDGVLIDYIGNSDTVVVPDNVTGFKEDIFSWRSDLKSITLGKSVKSIGASAFEKCWNLASIKLSDGVTSIGEHAFLDCNRLAQITIPDSAADIGNNAFENCRKLKSVTIGKGLKTIGESAFYECTSLTEITIPDSVTSIGEYAFSGCSKLKKVTIGKNVRQIGDYTFSTCSFRLTIYGYTGTYAESYAKQNYIDFVALDATAEPTAKPTPTPTAEPTTAPTEESTAKPTTAPTEEPTAKPTTAPTATSTPAPTNAPTKVTLNKTKATLVVGAKLTLKAKLTPAKAKTALTWSSSNRKVAVVTKKGVVKALKKGKATITVKTADGKKATCKITVPAAPKKVAFAKKSYSVKAGKKITLKTKLTPAKAKTTLKWTSSNKKIATVSSKGVVKGIRKGTVTITVKTANGKKATVKVTVK